MRGTVAVTFSWLLLLRPAFGQTPSPQEIATAEVLFQDAKKLMAAGKYAQACPKLVESQKLDPGGGTLVTLALCHEAEGKTASAWAEFGEALTLALKDGRVDRATVAREHAARLEPRLSRLTIRVPAAVADLEGVEILQDAVALGRAVWGTALPVDPGEHLIEARARGKKTSTRIILVAPDGDRQAIEVAPLENDPARTTPSDVAMEGAPKAPVETGAARRTAGWVTGAAGVALLGTASYFGLQAISDHDRAKRLCPASTCADIEGVNLNESSRTEADVATVGFALGGVALGVAAYLLLSAPASRSVAAEARAFHAMPSRVQWVPLLAKDGARAVVSLEW